MFPKVSIVTPVYNGGSFIEEYFESILAQTFQNWECIVVNDGSTDNTLKIIEKYASRDVRISYFTIPNSGAPKTPRDLAISKAKGEWILPVDADDKINGNYIEEMLSRAQKTSADIIFPCVKYFKDELNGTPIYTLPIKSFDQYSVIDGKDAVVLTTFDVKIGTNGGLIKHSLWQFLSLFNTKINFLRADEYDMRELLINAGKVAFSDSVYYYRQHAGGVTKKISAKSFEYLIADSILEQLFVKYFGENSSQVRQIRKHRVLGIVSRKILWFRTFHQFNSQERRYIRRLMNEYSKEIKLKYYFDFSVLKKISYYAILQYKTSSSQNVKRFRSRCLEKIRAGWFLFKRLSCFRKLFINYIEISITEKCTLNCQFCSAEVPNLQNPKHYETDKIIKSLKNLLDQTGWISWLRILGGEPFLHRDLGTIVDFVLQYKQIREIRIVTNATIIPSPDLLEILKKKRVVIDISSYDSIKKKQEQFTQYLKEQNLSYHIWTGENWRDYGNYDKRNFSEKILKKSKRKCSNVKHRHIENGKLYFCTRVLNLNKQSDFHSDSTDFVDLLDTNNLKSRIKQLFKKKYVVACDHCNPPWGRPNVPIAIQIEGNKNSK